VLIWACVTFVRNCIELSARGADMAECAHWAARYSVAALVNGMAGCSTYLAMTTLRPHHQSALFWGICIAVNVYRKLGRTLTVWLLPNARGRMCSTAVDMPVATAFYVQPNYESLVAYVATEVAVDAFVYALSRHQRAIASVEDFVWTHTLAWIAAMPVELRHTIGVRGIGQRLLAPFAGQLVYALAASAVPVSAEETRAERKLEPFYSTGDLLEWASHTTAAVMMVIGTAYSIRAM
jgi:hypothetical protein